MRTRLFARALTAVIVPSATLLAIVTAPSHAGRLPLRPQAAAAVVDSHTSPPATADIARPEPVRTSAGRAGPPSSAPAVATNAAELHTPPAAGVATTPEPVGTFAGVRYGPSASELLDLYLPQRSPGAGPVPVIVYLHSGGWVGGSRANVDDAAAAQVARGWALASVDYQLATPGGGGSFPGAVHDVKRAIRFLKAAAGAWGLDAGRVVVMGASAGGHLAALVGASPGRLEPDVTGALAGVDSSVAAVVDLVGITDMASFSTTDHPWAAPLTAAFLGCALVGGRAACPPALLEQASVGPYVSAASPPIFMAYGAEDTLVVPATQGAPLAALWARAHGGDPRSVTYEVIAGAGHNIGAAQLDMTALDAFLDGAGTASHHACSGPQAGCHAL
jgi:acetyl esterase/lipase